MSEDVDAATGFYSLHQCDFMPWLGFWQKVAHARVFDVRIYEQFRRNGWQNYSFIGEPSPKAKWGVKWGPPVEAPFRSGATPFRFDEVRVVPGFADGLLDAFAAHHANDRYFHQINSPMTEWLRSVDRFTLLWEVNFHLLLRIKAFLGLDATIALTPKSGRPSDDFAANTARFGCEGYLSGPHGQEYLDPAPFDLHHRRLVFQDTTALLKAHPQSVVAVISKHGMAHTLERLHDLKTSAPPEAVLADAVVAGSRTA
jgi:hypothetical protein